MQYGGSAATMSDSFSSPSSEIHRSKPICAAPHAVLCYAAIKRSLSSPVGGNVEILSLLPRSKLSLRITCSSILSTTLCFILACRWPGGVLSCCHSQ